MFVIVAYDARKHVPHKNGDQQAARKSNSTAGKGNEIILGTLFT